MKFTRNQNNDLKNTFNRIFKHQPKIIIFYHDKCDRVLLVKIVKLHQMTNIEFVYRKTKIIGISFHLEKKIINLICKFCFSSNISVVLINRNLVLIWIWQGK